MKIADINHKINIHPITLKFSGDQKKIEKSFKNDYFGNYLNHFRLCIVYSILLYGILSPLDFLMFREQFSVLFGIRFFVVIPIFCIGFYYTFNENYKSVWRFSNNFFVILTSAGFLTMMIYCPAPKSYTFYSGLIVCLIFGYAYIKSFFLDASITGIIVIILYIVSSIKIDTPFEIFSNNFSYLFIANILGMIISYSTESSSRREFFLREMLKIEQAKVESANQDLEIKVKKRTKDLINKTESLRMEITERKQLEAELQVKNLVFESAITANNISNAEGYLTSINNTFLNLWGYEKKEDVLGKPIAQFFKFEHEAKVVLTSLTETSIWKGEFTGLKKNGNTFIAYGFATTIHDFSKNIKGFQSSVIDISVQKNAEKGREQLILQLQKTLAEVKTLRGLIPICSMCKKIRDDKGYWNSLEGYIEKHSDASFSHSICAECSDEIYGDEDWYIKMKEKKG